VACGITADLTKSAAGHQVQVIACAARLHELIASLELTLYNTLSQLLQIGRVQYLERSKVAEIPGNLLAVY
jgi:hypothetical protein